jgi:hypothetical protein
MPGGILQFAIKAMPIHPAASKRNQDWHPMKWKGVKKGYLIL